MGDSQEDLLKSFIRVDDLADRYVMGSLLGEGRFSKVWSAKPASRDAPVSVPVALKEIALDVLEEDEEAFEMLEAEVDALRHSSTHESLGERVVKLHEVIKTDEFIFLVLDRVPGEELFNVIDAKGSLPLVTVHVIMQQLLSALAALHELGIVHRDIKPENLMVSGLEDPNALRLTLIDFGYADVKSGGENLERLAGSPEYAAPEVLSWLAEDGDKYNHRCDVWSVGITAHVLISGELPFEIPDDADEDQIAEIAKKAELLFEQPIWRTAGMDGAMDFVRQCLITEIATRPSAREVLAHAWLCSPVETPAPPPSAEAQDTSRSEREAAGAIAPGAIAAPLGDHSC
mmetsp:Transcript_8202/g.21617  ORF Transcript_8202/g.21617 Transcript_8202/m.21617 type:complete len:345 (-) Transcript_8202:412-1446(-)